MNERLSTNNRTKGFLQTRPLWLRTQFGIPQFVFPEVDLSDFSPGPIPQNLRLGHQMEYVCRQLLDQCQEYEVLVYNLPIRAQKQTLGEIDFILREWTTRQLIHVELTYKFYIIDPDISEPIHQLMGPNKRDMFYTKMEKIKNEQFKLLHSYQGYTALKERDIDADAIVHQACFKAQLFEPYGSAPLGIRPLNPECIVGYWLRMVDFQSDAFKKYHFYIPNKSQWVLEPTSDVEWTSHYGTLLEINLRLLKRSSPMVWMQKSQNEIEKFFVVWW